MRITKIPTGKGLWISTAEHSYTQFSHFIDLLIWMVGDIGNVEVLTRNFLHQSTIDFEDTGVVALEFTNGALGTINYTVNSYKKNMEGSISLFGEKGTVKIGDSIECAGISVHRRL